MFNCSFALKNTYFRKTKPETAKMSVFTNGQVVPLPGMVEKQRLPEKQDVPDTVKQVVPNNVKQVVPNNVEQDVPDTVKQPDERGQQPVKRVDSNWSFLTVFIALFNAFVSLFNAFVAFMPRLAVASRRIRKNFLLLLRDFRRCVRRGSLSQSPNAFNFFLLACCFVSLNLISALFDNHIMYNISVFGADVAIFYWIYSNWNTYKPAPKVTPAVEHENSNTPWWAVGVITVVAGVVVAGSVFAGEETAKKDDKNK